MSPFRSGLTVLALVALLFVRGDVRAAESPLEWPQIQALVNDQKFQEALDATLVRLEEAKKRGDERGWTRGLIWATQLRTGLHGYETAVRFLREQPWPKDELHRAALDLFYAQSLQHYLHAYQWEIRQREKVASPEKVDLKQWTVEDIATEIQRAHQEIWTHRQALGTRSVEEASDYLATNSYPLGIRSTLRDAVTYLRVELLADTSLWRPEQQNELFRLDLEALLKADPAFVKRVDLVDPRVHPLEKIAAVLGDLEQWHTAEGRPEAALEAKLERFSRLHAAFTGKDERAKIRNTLEKSLPGYQDVGWWAMGMSRLAEFQRTDGMLVRAHETATKCLARSPDSVGGERCLSIQKAIEAPDYSLAAMQQDGPQKRSIEVTYRNLPELWFRAYEVDLEAWIKKADDYYLFPSQENMKALLKGKPVAEWRRELPPTPDFGDHRAFVTPPLKKKGQYVVLASPRRDFALSGNRVLGTNFLVTDLVLVNRQLPDGSNEITVLQGSTGEPVDSAEVVLYEFNWNKGHRPIKSERTGRSGEVVFKPSVAGQRGGAHFVLAKKSADKAVLMNAVSFWAADRDAESSETFVYTDRSVYRPMQSVHWKVVAFSGSRERAKFRVLEGREVTVVLFDANGQVVEEKKVRTNNYGSASGTFSIPTGRLLGEWTIRTSPSGQAPIRVEEYKRPTFEVELKAPDSPLRLNKPATFKGQARYYFGLPVVSGAVKWRVTRVPMFPWWWSRWYGPANEQTQVVATGTSSLDDEGVFKISFTPEAEEPKTAADRNVTWRYEVAADLTDEGGETRSAQKVFRLGWISVEAQISSDESFSLANQSQTFKVRRVDLNGAPRTGKGTWTVLALRQPEQARMPAEVHLPASTEELPEGQPKLVHPDDRLRPRWATDYTFDAELARWQALGEKAKGTLQHDAEGQAKAEVPALPPGAYRLRYETVDDFGAKYETTHDFVVVAKDVVLEAPAALVVQHNTRKVGEVARVLVTSGFRGQPLIFDVYRGRERVSRRLLRAQQDPALLEIPITHADRGGFTVSLTTVRDHQVVQLSENVLVPYEDKELKLEFATFRDHLRPGAKETFKVTVKGAPGTDPVVGAAELLAYMYDESLDVFAPHNPPSILGLYPFQIGLPSTQTSLSPGQIHWVHTSDFPPPPPYPSLGGDRLRFYEGYGIGGPGLRYRGLGGGVALRSAPMTEGAMGRKSKGEAADEAAPPPAPSPAQAPAEASLQDAKAGAAAPQLEQTLRSNFAETAFWKPHLLLGKDGSAILEFTVPDSVTGWNVWVHAVTRDLRGGSITRKTRSVKELMVRPYLPRFLREGDKAEVRVVVNNASDTALAGDVEFDIVDPETNASVLSEFGLTPKQARARFESKAGKGATVSFAITAPRRPRTVAFKVTARSGNLSDGELRPVPVLPGRLHLTQSRFVTLRDRDTRQLSFADMAKGDDPTLVHDQLVVNVDAQLFYTVLQALPYLVNYPYECTEQTLNRFVSTGIVTSLYDQYPAVARMAQKLSKRDTRLETWDAADPNRKMALEETPWLVEAQGGKDAGQGLVNVLDPRIAKAEREASLAKLRKAQTSSGAFPWFPGGPPSPYMTLYILHGLARAADHGVEVPRDMTQQAWGYVARHFREEYADKLLKEDCCWEFLTFLNYVATSFPDASYTGEALTPDEQRKILDHSFRNWKRHSPYLKGYLALTLNRMGRKSDADKVWASVMDSAKTTDDQGTFWAPEDRAWLWYNDTIETHAFALRTLMELQPKDARRHGLVQWLLINKKLSHWKSTRATAEVIYALTKYLEQEQALGVRETAVVTVGPKRAEFVFEPDAFTGKGNRVVIPGEQVEVDPKRMSTITVEKTGKGFAFASATWQFSTEKLPPEARGDFFEVTRTYFRRDRKGTDAVLTPLAQGAKVEVGDEIEVHLSLRTKHAAEYVHLRDPRAAGLEPENAVSRYKWDLGIAWYEEVRDSGTNFFFEWLPAGEYTFKYRLRANMGGNFRVGPAEVQSMYAPEFNAYSAGNQLRVEGSGPN